MKWSWSVGSVAGIRVRIHATFPLLLAWVALAALHQGASPAAVAETVVFMLVVFLLVVLHESAHALVARRFGIRTRDITLLPIGGVARLERMPREPKQELLIALAGPTFNVALAMVLWALLAATGQLAVLRAAGTLAESSWTWASIIVRLFGINVSLAVFNLLPAFPLDGGRVLRALLALRTGDYARATAAAARVGRAFALLFGLAGLFLLDSPVLVVIGLFVWLAAASEAAEAQTEVALEHVSLASLLITDVRTLSPDEPLARAAELSLHGFQRDFPVLENGALVGMLAERDLVRGLARIGLTATVRDAMRRDFATATLQDAPREVLRDLASARGHTLPVVQGRSLVGLLTPETVMEFLTIRGALEPVPAA